jgi:hypothetical protein
VGARIAVLVVVGGIPDFGIAREFVDVRVVAVVTAGRGRPVAVAVAVFADHLAASLRLLVADLADHARRADRRRDAAARIGTGRAGLAPLDAVAEDVVVAVQIGAAGLRGGEARRGQSAGKQDP